MHESQLTIKEIKDQLNTQGEVTVEPLCAHCAATLFYDLTKQYPDGYFSIFGIGPAGFRLHVDINTRKEWSDEGNDD